MLTSNKYMLAGLFMWFSQNVNLFHVSDPFLYLLKTSEIQLRFQWV